VKWSAGRKGLVWNRLIVKLLNYQCPQVFCDFLVQPRILAKTVIVERTIIDLRSSEIAVAEDDSGDIVRQEITDKRQFYTKFWREYLDQMQLDDVGIPHSAATSENLFLYPAINKQSWISAFVAKSVQKVGVYFRVPKEEYGELMYQYILEHKAAIVDQLGEEPNWSDAGEGREKYISIHFAVDDPHAESSREAIFEFYNTNINNFVNAFRPLLKEWEP